MTMKIRLILASTPMSRLRHFALVGARCLLASASFNTASATVYRWVDDQGKVYYSEVVPQRYQGGGNGRRSTAIARERPKCR